MVALPEEVVSRLIAYLEDQRDKMSLLLLAELREKMQAVTITQADNAPVTTIGGKK
jgi:hypothetical protein